MAKSIVPSAPALTVSLLAFLTACAPVEDGASVTKEDVLSGKADGSGDICAEYGWYDDQECDDFCDHPDPDCCEEQCEKRDDRAVEGWCFSTDECTAFCKASAGTRSWAEDSTFTTCVSDAPLCYRTIEDCLVPRP